MAQDEPRGVVVGVDGSDPARRALDWAVTEAQLRGLPLYVVAAAPNPPAMAALVPGEMYVDDVDAGLETVRATVTEMAEAATSGAADAAGGHVVEVTVRVFTGTATEVLLGMSERHELVVVGSRGAGGFSRLLLGSVSTAVVHHSACPVLVVRS